MSKFEDIRLDLVPNKKQMIRQPDILKKCKEMDMPISLRTLQLYQEKGLVKRGHREGKEVYYPEQSVMNELSAIHILKTTFSKSISEIQSYAKHPSVHLQNLVGELHRILTYMWERDKNPKKAAQLFYEYANNKAYQTVAEKYFERVGERGSHEVGNLPDFIKESLE